MAKQKLTYDDFTVEEISTIENHKKSYAKLNEYGLMVEAWRDNDVLTVIWDLGQGNKEKFRYKAGNWY